MYQFAANRLHLHQLIWNKCCFQWLHRIKIASTPNEMNLYLIKPDINSSFLGTQSKVICLYVKISPWYSKTRILC